MTSASTRPRPTVLCILDGWGDREDADNNAIAQADTPVWDRLVRQGPKAQLDASEGFVGLPSGQMGNSEVGHMNLGAGRVVLQDLPRIDKAIEDGSLEANPALARFIAALKKSGGTAHIMGLMSPGGVHAHQDHIAALVGMLEKAGIETVVHAFLDGRDTPPRSAIGYVRDFMEKAPGVKIATVTGRYFAMDRDKRWDRVSRAYNVITTGTGNAAATAVEAIEASYTREESDEFVAPTAIDGYAGMEDGDGLLMANFRADRAREILLALIDPAFDGFARQKTVRFAAKLGMVEYSTEIGKMMDVLFPPEDLHDVLGEVVSRLGMKQLRIAETEKYAHVTFFFNGGREEPFEGEDRILIPSPNVATYDLQPEMSAFEVTDRLVEAIGSSTYDLIIVNYANTDMVGHTGNLKAAISAVEAVDTCLGRLEKAVLDAGGAMLVTADHGNAEMMADSATGQAHTAHTMNRVPLILVGNNASREALRSGRLADIAPTLLDIMGLDKPAAMTGKTLIDHAQKTAAE